MQNTEFYFSFSCMAEISGLPGACHYNFLFVLFYVIINGLFCSLQEV